MAFIDPDGNGTATAWAGNFFAVDDGVRQPNTPDGALLSGGTTDETSETLTFGTTTFVAGTFTLWVYGTGGNKRAVDVAYSVNGSDPGTGHASRAELIPANGAAGWRSRVITIASQTELDNLRVQLIVNTTAGGGGASQPTVDAVYVEVPDALVDADAEVAWAEVEVPTASAGAQVAWAELEVPTANARADVAWAEVETPTAPAAAEVAWAEFQISDPDADAEISWAEVEVPTAPADAEIAWAELEVPTADASAEVAWAELEVGLAPASAQVAWAALEIDESGGDSDSYHRKAAATNAVLDYYLS